MNALSRRRFLQLLGLSSAAAAAPTLLRAQAQSVVPAATANRVVVVGGGFAGATVAKYLRLWGGAGVDVTLVEANPSHVSCILSNLVLNNSMSLSQITFNYAALQQKYGVRIVTGKAVGIEGKALRLADGQRLDYERLVLAPGIAFLPVPGLKMNRVPHAWQAGPQTTLLQKQLAAMPAGGTFVMTIPPAPYRCPPGPYERACTVASYFKKAKPKSKIIILDGNPDIASKKGLFLAAWKKHFGFGTADSMIDYRPNNMPRSVDPAKMMVGTEFDDVKADVINVVPPMQAAAICGMAGVRKGLDGKEGPWCAIDYRSFESLHVKNVHVLGDSTLTNFPKSGSVANNTAKMAASAIVEMFNGRDPDAAPVVTNTCYSATGMGTAFHVATVFRYQAEKKADDGKVTPASMVAQKGGGVSKEESELEFAYMEAWAKNVWADTLGLPDNFNYTVKG